MKNLLSPDVDRYRRRTADVIDRYGSFGDEAAGMFDVPNPWRPGDKFLIIASNDAGWDHVSVSGPQRTPTWREMDLIKRLFFNPDETAMQLHVPAQDHINNHPNCLHLWRPHDAAIPRPPEVFV